MKLSGRSDSIHSSTMTATLDLIAGSAAAVAAAPFPAREPWVPFATGRGWLGTMSADAREPAITRIARRRARPGHAGEYEALVREMFALMRQHHGFLGADLIPPESEGGQHAVVVNFASEDDLTQWDDSADRRAILARMRAHAEGEPEHRRLSAIDE